MDGIFSSGTATTIAERLSATGEDWADKEAGASLLEENRKSVRAQIAIGHLESAGSVSKAEMIAEASTEYREHLRLMVEARKAANIARVNYDAGKTWVDLCRSKEATERAAMQIR